MEARLSVVVPVYNRERLLVRALDSIAGQNVRPLSLVVVDNGSTDGSRTVAEEWASANCRDDFEVRVISESRPGAARARQTGLETVSTEWVYFFDSDDEMIPGILAEALNHSKGKDIVYWKLDIRGLDGRVMHHPCRRNPFRGHVFNATLSTQSYMVRTEFLRRAGGWNAEAMVWNDWELGIRLLLANPLTYRLDRTGAVIYRQKESITGTGFSEKQGSWEDVMDGLSRLPGASRQLLEMIDYRRVILAAHYRREGNLPAAAELLEKTLSTTTCSPGRKLLLRLIFRYTVAGGRGAYKLWC